MSDLKSKLPDLKELGSIAQKLFTDVKHSVNEIIDDYKRKRETDKAAEQPVQETRPTVKQDNMPPAAKEDNPLDDK